MRVDVTSPDPAVEIVEHVDDELVAAFARLIPQLSTSSPIPGRGHLEALVRHPSTTLAVVLIGGRIVGTATLALFPIPTGVRAWIEDVVVDGAARGHGLGEILVRTLLEIARQRGAATVYLTSRPTREAANRLYVRMGFVKRETNAYQYTL